MIAATSSGVFRPGAFVPVLPFATSAYADQNNMYVNSLTLMRKHDSLRDGGGLRRLR